jgi:hypothetical protein
MTSMASTARTTTSTTSASTPATSPARSSYPTPVLAAVGVVDLAAEKARHVPAAAESARADVVAWFENARQDASARLAVVRSRTEALPAEIPAQVDSLRGEAEELPAKAKAAADKAFAELGEQYGLLADRGEALIAKIRSNRETVALQDQVKATESKAKAARTTARKSATATRTATKAAATSAAHTARAAEAAAEAAIESVGS